MDDEGFSRADWIRLIATVAWLGIFVYRPQLILAITLLVIGFGMIAYNAINFWVTVVLKNKASSAVPIIGGVAASIGVAIIPAEGIWKWSWIPLILDWGGLPYYLSVMFGYKK